jgi:hypothetical protein
MEVLVRCEPLSNPIIKTWCLREVLPAILFAVGQIQTRPASMPRGRDWGCPKQHKIRKLQPQTPFSVGRELLSFGIDSRRLREKGEINERDFLKRFSGTIFSFALWVHFL